MSATKTATLREVEKVLSWEYAMAIQMEKARKKVERRAIWMEQMMAMRRR